jgi:hypothetical protein
MRNLELSVTAFRRVKVYLDPVAWLSFAALRTLVHVVRIFGLVVWVLYP